MSTDEWSGRRVMRARAHVATLLPAPCGQCGETVTLQDKWVVGHIQPRSIRPDLTWTPTNWRVEHRTCSDASGSAVRSSLQHPMETRVPFRAPSPRAPAPVREGLLWDPEALSGYPWLFEYLDVPADASPPLYMTLPPEDAVGSYGEQAIRWIEDTQTDKSGRPLTLRWWQALAITRQLEYRADGSLVHRNVLESCPRRAGKSVRMRGLAVWRLEHGPGLFDEVQTVAHTGSDLAVCEEIQRDAWKWAELVAGWKVVRANGRRAIETPDGDRWMVQAQEAAGYSLDVTLGIVDEAWNVKPGAVSEGLEPAALERKSPQIYITSTSHRRATSLMRTRLQTALTMDDPTTLLMVWAAPAGSDPGDPDVWRAASPYWSEERRAYIATKYAAAVAGEVDPQADDPDPMAGFSSQYLNTWQLTTSVTLKGDPIITEQDWDELVDEVPEGAPDAAAVESWFKSGVTVALAWRIGDEVIVSCRDLPDLESAAAVIKGSGFRRTATVGASLVEDPAFTGIRTQKGQGRVSWAVQEVRRLLSEDAFLHDGGDHLTSQIHRARTLPGADGPRMASNARADALKAAVWAVHACRRKSVGKPRILVAE